MNRKPRKKMGAWTSEAAVRWCRSTQKLRESLWRRLLAEKNCRLLANAENVFSYGGDGTSLDYSLFVTPGQRWFLGVGPNPAGWVRKVTLSEALLLLAHVQVPGPLWQLATLPPGKPVPMDIVEFFEGEIARRLA